MDSQESSPTSQFQKHQFFGTQPSLRSNSHILLEKPTLLSVITCPTHLTSIWIHAQQAAKEYYFPHFPVAKYNHRTDVVIAVTASKDIQVLIPGLFESSLCGNRLLANLVELRILRWRDYSGL